MQTNFDLPEKFLPLRNPDLRYLVFYGGRGGAKTETIARHLIVESLDHHERILCAREIQNSIKDSVHRVLWDAIEEMKLTPFFRKTEASITNIYGSEFIFKGIKNNTSEIKSMKGITKCWLAEAAKTSENSWDILDPTIREPKSQIIVDFNTDLEEDATYQRFVVNKPPNCASVYVNYWDNPWFKDPLRPLMEYDKQYHYEKWLNKWAGLPKQNSDAQVFKDKWEILDFPEPSIEEIYQHRFFFGADWGFSVDPTALVRCFIKDQCLYIDYEAYQVGCEIDHIANLFDTVPLSRKFKMWGDSSRPDTISYVRRQGFNIDSVKKSRKNDKPEEKAPVAGYVEDGIEYLRGTFKKIYVHPRCKNMINEFKFYCFEVDKNSGIIIPKLVDKHNHLIDGLRYALSDYIRNKVSILQGLH